ncbi:N-6 DNA methylase [Aliarcobacter butzleri]|uniref:N-6 DNA methylase n=1 Tax=Aliarcobacter butzleri TaxID=28197 RepID=UPI002B2422FE|nr:N-6 DNA methylase [Aliarcobacter butzleri]
MLSEIITSTENINFIYKKEQLGAVYTPNLISDWICRYISTIICKNGTILDPTSGDGSLLYSASKYFQNPLIGVDINHKELIKVHQRFIKNDLQTFCFDGLNPSSKLNTLKFWKIFLDTHNIKTIISNPPWGINIKHSNSNLKDNGFDLASGQFDSYDLFIEILTKAAKLGTILAFIIPDSIFLNEHKNLRKYILDNCNIKLIARLGEGIFKKVNRGTSILILEKGQKENNVIECFRLNRLFKNNILLNNISIDEAYETLVHSVKQSRFKINSNYLFDIDVKDEDIVYKKIEQINSMKIENYCLTGRGIEISKYGKLLECPKCNFSYSIPLKPKTINCKCGHSFLSTNVKEKIIITKNKGNSNFVPLIVGEDVQRYSVKNSRFIMKDVKGINYKTKEHFKMKKMLVRKTGIGIKASIDKTGALTNQVVFHYIPKKDGKTPEFILEYLVGILSSRTMLAYYLKKYGENEWRTHPYITQKIISELPIPCIKNEENYRIAEKIAQLVNKLNKYPNLKLDMEIEKCVMKLYSLNKNDFSWVMNVLEESQQLEPIKTLIVHDYKKYFKDTDEL